MNKLDYIKFYISNVLWEDFKRFFFRSSPRWLIFLIDLFIAAIAFSFAFLVRFNFDFEFLFPLKSLTLYIFFNIILFFVFKPYVGVVRHTGWKDIKNILQVTGTLFIFLIIQTVLARNGQIPNNYNLPRTVIFLAPFFQAFLMGGLRMLYKAFFYKISRLGRLPVNVLIFGTGMEAIQLADLLKSDPKINYIIKGFVSQKSGTKKFIQGIRIYLLDELTEEFFSKQQIDQLIIAQTQKNPLNILKIGEKFAKAGIQIRTIPPPENWMKNMISLSDIKNFDLSALMERQTISRSTNNTLSSIQNKVVWVTGAAGSIGSELVKQIIWHHPKKIILLDQAETPLYELETELKNLKKTDYQAILLDLANYSHVETLFKKQKPDIIFHAAAYKHVPVMETNPYYGIEVNIFATKFLMEKAREYEVEKFIQISTDKAVNPTNIMGATKRVAELIARCLQEKSEKTQFIVTRFGNVLGSNGSVIHLFKKQISQGGPVTVTHKEVKRFFMTISEAAQLVLEASDIGQGGNIYVFDMGQPIKIFDLAVKMIHLSGKKYPDDISIVITGLRPGEKLNEEILTSSEKVEKQIHEKLFISKLAPLDCHFLEKKLNELSASFKNLDTDSCIRIIKQILPEYKSNHSPYEKFD